jgi:hypothetical protein
VRRSEKLVAVIPFALIAAACTKLMILKSPQYRM